MENTTKNVPVMFEDGTIMHIEVEKSVAEQNVTSIKDIFSIDGVKESIQSFSTMVYSSLEKVKPDKSSVEFGFELSVKDGKLISVLAQGEGKASVKIKLEWNGKKA